MVREERLHKVLLSKSFRQDFLTACLDLFVERLCDIVAVFGAKLFKLSFLDLICELEEQHARREIFCDEVLNVHQDFVESLKLYNITLYDLKDRDRCPKQGPRSLEEKEVPDN